MAGKKIAVVTGGMGGLGESITTKMADAGYRVVVTYSPSNTKYRAWLEEMKGRGYSFSAFPVDVVDVFVNSALAGDIADQAVALGAKAVWFQLGVIDEAAYDRTREAGLLMVMDRSPGREIPRLGLS